MNDDMLKELGEHITANLSQDISDYQVALGELTIITRAEVIVPVMTFLRDDSNCQFKILLDVTAVDYPEREKRFEVVYHLLSIRHNQRVRVKLSTDERSPVPTVETIHPSAGWFERETYDMYGVLFSGHGDLRRILTDYGFEGHPLRKDFPLTGYVEMRYDEEQKRCVYEPVTLTQDFRRFDFPSPWEGANYVLPGDEKAEEQS